MSKDNKRKYLLIYRIVRIEHYISTDAFGKNILYYDLELTRKIPDSTGGKSIQPATIVTRDKIIVPVVPEINDYFNLSVDEFG